MKPILFNTNMVRAILAGRKTVTRRVVKPQPPPNIPHNYLFIPPYRPGDILYVRETWQNGFRGTYLYKASAGYDLFMTAEGELVSNIPWRPSIHMPREAARIFLRVTDVRVERLQDITGEQVFAEGTVCRTISDIRAEVRPAIFEFQDLWNNTIKKADRAIYGWEANPFVWVIEFERIGREEAQPHD